MMSIKRGGTKRGSEASFAKRECPGCTGKKKRKVGKTTTPQKQKIKTQEKRKKEGCRTRCQKETQAVKRQQQEKKKE